MSEWSEWGLVVTTIALVIFTAVLARFTGRLWRANDRLAAANERLAKIEEDRDRAAMILGDEAVLRRLALNPSSLEVPGDFPTLRQHIPSLLDRGGAGSLNGELNLHQDDPSKLEKSLLDHIASEAGRKLQENTPEEVIVESRPIVGETGPRKGESASFLLVPAKHAPLAATRITT